MLRSSTTSLDANVEVSYNGNYHEQTEHGKMDDLASEVLRLRDNGWGITKIARHIKKRNHYVIEVIKKAGATEGQPYFLTDPEKARIRELRLLGWFSTDIALEIGRSKQAVLQQLKTLKLNKRQLRPIEVDGDIAVLTLTRGQKALIDAVDLPLVKGRSWFTLGASGRFYAATRGDEGVVLTLHRFLMKPPADKVVDHVNGDGLDNRRCNLRLATTQQNTANSRRNTHAKSGYIGVHAHKSGKFFANFTINLGTYDNAEDAARAYDAKVTEMFGEFAMTNKKRGLLA
jgi:hypothetical protein